MLLFPILFTQEISLLMAQPVKLNSKNYKNHQPSNLQNWYNLRDTNSASPHKSYRFFLKELLITLCNSNVTRIKHNPEENLQNLYLLK